MLIFTQDGKHIINAENFDYFEVIYRGDGYWNDIYAECSDDTILLGKYKTEEEAKEVFEKIAQSYGAINIFYMPKENEDD